MRIGALSDSHQLVYRDAILLTAAFALEVGVALRVDLVAGMEFLIMSWPCTDVISVEPPANGFGTAPELVSRFSETLLLVTI
jgi:hypothetical protein